MKKLTLATVCTLIVCANTFAEGLINFLNTSATLVTLSSNGVNLGPMPGVLGQFKFQLFIAPAGTTDPLQFVPTSVEGTNLAAAGRFNGGLNLSVTGVEAGETRSILVRGWSTSLGDDYATARASWDPFFGPGYMGESVIAPYFIFGGFDGTATHPTSPALGGVSGGIHTGFALVGVPEPSSIAIVALAVATARLVRRRLV